MVVDVSKWKRRKLAPTPGERIGRGRTFTLLTLCAAFVAACDSPRLGSWPEEGGAGGSFSFGYVEGEEEEGGGGAGGGPLEGDGGEVGVGGSPQGSGGSEEGGETGREARIRLLPLRAAVAEGGRLVLQAFDGEGEALPSEALRWESAQPEIADFEGPGELRARSPGEVEVVARAGELRASAVIEVEAARREALLVEPATLGIVLGDAVELAAFVYDGVGRRREAGEVTWRSDRPEVATVDEEGRVIGVGPGVAKVIAAMEGEEVAAEVEVKLRFVGVAVGEGHVCAWGADGRTFCWGRNLYGQVGAGAEEAVIRLPTEVGGGEGPQFRRLGLGSEHGCGLDEEGEVWCWGNNNFQKLGERHTELGRSYSPLSLGLAAYGFRELVTGGHHTCGLDGTFHAYCWGGNSADRELGNADTELISPSPLPVSGIAPGYPPIEFRSLAAGFFHTCGLTVDHRLFCWGRNKEGQIGDGSTQSPKRPKEPLFDERFRAVALGAAHTCATTRQGRTFCWGDDAHGQLGVGAPGPRQLSPVPLDEDGRRFVQLAAGRAHTCGLDEDGTLSCWGSNENGQLGKEGPDASLPRRIGGTFLSIAAGGDTTCALHLDGRLSCWGDNRDGQLGDGSPRSHAATPVPVAYQ